MPQIGWTGEDEFFSALQKIVGNVEQASQDIVDAGSLLVIRAAQGNFSGSHAPGQPHVGGEKPNIVTGDLRRSISADPQQRLGIGYYSAVVAPRMVYGRRVELGFSGSDSLGRNYNSPGYPYFGPAISQIIPDFESVAAKLWGNALNR